MTRLGVVAVALALASASGCENKPASEKKLASELPLTVDSIRSPAPAGHNRRPSADDAAPAMSESADSKSAAGASVAAPRSPTVPGTPSAPHAPSPIAPAPKRLVHYNGFAKLSVTSPADSLKAAVKLCESAGGYVEKLTDTTVTLRVPVAGFRTLYSQTLLLGDVLERSITAQDVTDAFTALTLRIKTLRASRDRLITLLARSVNQQEKLELLREVQRLTEEVDQLEMQAKTIESLANFSRITLEMVPRQAQTQTPDNELAAFRWIRNLSPFRRDAAFAGKRLQLDAPKDMVVLDDREHWIAESADGAVVWAHRKKNAPLGDADFWAAALAGRLGPEYASHELATVGGFRVLRLIDQSEKAYRYLVAVKIDGDELQIVEIYYPSAEHEKRYQAGVQTILEKGKV